MAANLVSVRDVQKDFRSAVGTVRAIDRVSFDINEGEFLTIVGPSGCGKSTLLSIIAGLIPLSSGNLDRDERVKRRGGIGMVFQKPVLLAWRTILDNVLTPAEILHTDLKAAKSKAMELIDLVGLAGFDQSWPYQLSGGMQQRTSICRALLPDPPLLLMDEPFGALDAITRERMNLELQRIWSTTGKTVVFVTHSIEESVLLSDRIVVMTARPGRIAEIIDNELPRPRDVETMGSALFTDYCSRIRRLLV